MGGLNAADRLRAGGLDAAKATEIRVAIGDIWIPPAGHPLAHPRASDPLDEEMVVDIMRRGIEQAVLVRDDGVQDGRRRLTLVDGCRRICHGKEAERRLEKSMRCKVELFTGDDAALIRERLRRNSGAFSKPDAPSVLAATFAQLAALGMTEEEIAVGPPVMEAEIVGALLAWDNLPSSVAAKVDAGDVPLDVLPALFDVAREDREQAADLILGAGAKTRRAARKLLRPAKKATQRRPPPAALARVEERLKAISEQADTDLQVIAAERGAWKFTDFVRAGVALARGDTGPLRELVVESAADDLAAALGPQKPGRKAGK